jgi:molybdopterin/thiamine biosynthesis adenylyltransferase/molybdopterin synthase catalytic subunit
MFSISSLEISSQQLHLDIQDQRSGAVVIFEGIVRNHNQGLDVKSLEYQVYHELAQKEGDKILQEAKLKFNIHHARAVHREGHLRLGEAAVWVGATASHRDDAFKATRYIIDEIKHRLPVWKKEHYLTADAKWVFCRDHHHHVHFEEKDFYQKQKNILDQSRLKKTHVLMVGLGGLGCPASVNLALAGVGKLTLVDYDKVSYDNLHRQFLFRPQHVGESKVKIAASLLREMNPFIEVDYHDSFFRPDHLEGIDFVIDGTDNMKTKYQIHDACLKYRLPLLSAGLFRDDAQLRTMIPGDGCWRCLQDVVPDDALFGNCNDFGTTGAWANTAGSILASEALELISTGKNSTSEMVLHLNLRTLTSFKVKKARKEDCQYCAGNFELVDTVMEVDEALSSDILDIRHLSDDEVLKSIQSREKVILCCHRGHRSLKVTQWLREQGHDHVYSLRGGAPR